MSLEITSSATWRLANKPVKLWFNLSPAIFLCLFSIFLFKINGWIAEIVILAQLAYFITLARLKMDFWMFCRMVRSKLAGKHRPANPKSSYL